MRNRRRYKGVTYVHGIATSGLFTSVTFGKSPVKGVGQSVFTEVGKDLLIKLESGEVGLIKHIS